MLRYQTHKKYVKPSQRREVPPEQTVQALKTLKAHRKFGQGKLEQDEISEIPGLESIINKGDSNELLQHDTPNWFLTSD
jgi:hypothetical protein|tara:strand:+ start:168 stop:404 length:237 start_codon:yes stop_codon:yes gene_type:complete